jgi:hypothetical protein
MLSAYFPAMKMETADISETRELSHIPSGSAQREGDTWPVELRICPEVARMRQYVPADDSKLL